MPDQTKTTEEIHGDSFAKIASLPADAEVFIDDNCEPDFTDEQLIEMEAQDREYRRRQAMRKIAVGRVAVVAAVLSLF